MSKTETKRERRRCTSWGPQDSRSDTEGSLLVFFFASCPLNLELNKSVTQKPDTDKKSPDKILLYLTKETGKGQPTKSEHFKIITTAL